MITVYEAQSSIDAKLIQDLLEMQNIKCHVLGDLLTGGIGELQPQGLIKILADQQDYKKARELIKEWEDQ